MSESKINDWNRAQTRLLKHHIPLFLLSVSSALLIYRLTKSDDSIFRMSFSTAYPAFALLAATLAVSPLQKLVNRTNTVSTDFRRDLGFWAAVMSLVHVAFGLNVHMRGRMWLLFLGERMVSPYIRFDMFGAANFSGLLAALVLIMLFATSNDWAIRRFGIKKWKKVQRWNYVLFGVVILHGILYQVIEKRIPPYTFIFAAIGLVVLILRIAGMLSRKKQKS